MPSATTAESRDSIAPSIAIANAGGRRARTSSNERPGAEAPGPGIDQGQANAGSWRGMPATVPPSVPTAWKRLPIVATSKPGTLRAHAAATTARRRQRDERRGHLGPEARPQQQEGEREEADGRVPHARRRQRLDEGPHAVHVVIRVALDLQAEEVLDLQRRDHDRDARGEAGRDRVGHELDEAAHAGEAHDDEQHARHQAGEEQAPQAEPGRHRRQQDDERRGRSGDLDARAAEQRDQAARDDGGVEAVLGRHAGRDGEGHRERQRDDADDQPGQHVGAQVGPGVALTEGLAECGGNGSTRAGEASTRAGPNGERLTGMRVAGQALALVVDGQVRVAVERFFVAAHEPARLGQREALLAQRHLDRAPHARDEVVLACTARSESTSVTESPSTTCSTR